MFQDQAFECDEIYTQRRDSLTDTPEDKNCVVCFNELSDTVVMPCRHLCICQKCCNRIRLMHETSDTINKCPLCRQQAEAFIHIVDEIPIS